MLDTPQQFLILSKCLIQESKMPKQSPFPRWLKLLIFDGNFLSLSFSRRPGSKKKVVSKKETRHQFPEQKNLQRFFGWFFERAFWEPNFLCFHLWGTWLLSPRVGWWFLLGKTKMMEPENQSNLFQNSIWGGGHLGFQGCFCNLLLLRMIRSQRLWEFFIHVNWFHGVRNLEGLMTYVHSVDSLLFSVPHLPGVSGYGGTWGNNSPMGTGFSSKETHNSSNV